MLSIRLRTLILIDDGNYLAPKNQISTKRVLVLNDFTLYKSEVFSTRLSLVIVFASYKEKFKPLISI